MKNTFKKLKNISGISNNYKLNMILNYNHQVLQQKMNYKPYRISLLEKEKS